MSRRRHDLAIVRGQALVLGIGGGGDVVGALAVARLCEALGTPFALGGVSWERSAVDPRPGPRPTAEIRGGEPLGEAAVLADAATTTDDGVPFSEAGWSGHPRHRDRAHRHHGGVAGASRGHRGGHGAPRLRPAARRRRRRRRLGPRRRGRAREPALRRGDGGGELEGARSSELRPGGARRRAATASWRPTEVLERVAALGRAGAWLGSWGVHAGGRRRARARGRPRADRGEPQVARCARGEIGEVPIRGGGARSSSGRSGRSHSSSTPPSPRVGASAGAGRAGTAKPRGGPRCPRRAGCPHRARLRA